MTATICWGCMFHPQHCYAITTEYDNYYTYSEYYNDPHSISKYAEDKYSDYRWYSYSLNDNEKVEWLERDYKSLIEYIKDWEECNEQYGNKSCCSDLEVFQEENTNDIMVDEDFASKRVIDTSIQNYAPWMGAIGFVSILVVIILLILALVVGFFTGYFVRGKVDEKKRRKEQEKLLNSNKKNSAPKTDKPVNQKVAVAETRIQTIEEPARDEIAQGETVQEDSQETQTPIINDPKEVPQYKAEHEATILFAGIPHEGIFSDAVTKNAGKAFYFIEAIGTTGEFSFISNETTLRYAKSSTTEFIECACNIVDNAGGFSNVITTRKGKVEKSGNDWKIIQKAEVRVC
ncbi:MAG: hypothetical protein K5864_01090 [Bacteroidales bacterium]|nr:hypothetical protein [Bacteroidales bacterium]